MMIGPHACAARVVPKVEGGKRAKLDLFAIEADANRCNDQSCAGNFQSRNANQNDPGAIKAPVDAVLFEPTLPQQIIRDVESDRIVFSSVVRHPVFFALTRGIQAGHSPEFALNCWLDKWERGNYCDLLPSGAAGRRVEEGIIERPAGFQSCIGPGATKAQQTRRTPRTRADLEAAKDTARSFSVLVVLEEYAEGMRAFCKTLGWPDCTLDPPKQHAGDKGLRAATQTGDARRLRARSAPHHGAKGALDHFGLNASAFAVLADATQLSTEFYFFARELNRAHHVDLGLRPPSTRLNSPGEIEHILF